MLQRSALVAGDEVNGARTALNAAALTYVAAHAQAVSSLLYFVLIALGLARSDE